MWRPFRKSGATAVTMAVLMGVAALGITGAASAASSKSGGNASGGAFATQANKLALTGPKGTGLTRGVTSTSIKVGCISSATDFPGFANGVQARFTAANKTGIDGRKISLVPCVDDGAVTQTDIQQTQQLVSQDGVFAMLYLSVNAYDSTTNFLNTNQVPYMGWGTSPGWCGTRWGFGWNGCLLPSLLPASNPLHTVVTASNVTAVVKAAGLQPKAVRLAVQSAQNPTGIEGNAAYTNIVKATGGKTVYDKATLPVSTAGVDFTPYAQSIVASKPNLVILSFNFAAIGPVAAAIKAAGYKGAIMDYVTYQPGLLASESQLASSLAGEYITSQTPPQEGNTPWTKQEQAQLKAIGKPTTLSLGTSIGYTEANNLVTMLQAVGKNLNTKTFDQKINGGKYVSNLTTAAQGSPGKMIWPAAHFIPADCAGIVQVKGTGYKVASPFQCYPSLSVP